MVGKQIWPGWDTIEVIGSGGFGKVYKIKKADDSGDFYSALKVVSIPKDKDEYRNYQADGFDDKSITEIFKGQVDDIVKEFKLQARFRGNTNIVSYEDHMINPKPEGFGWDILIRMELLKTLPDHYQTTPLGEKDVIKIGVDMCHALALCEKLKIVHRDIKPPNIFVNEFGDYKLGDFGVARVMENATHATRIGTCSYMAPEVYRGDAYDHTADLYSLGMVLFWLLNERRLPFLPMPPAVPTQTQVSEAQGRRFSGEAIPAPKNGSAALKSVVLKACAYNPADRFKTAEEFEEALRDASKGVVVGITATQKVERPSERKDGGRAAVAPPPPPPPPQQPPQSAQPQPEKKSKKGLIILLLCLLLVIGAGVGAYFLFGTGGDDDGTESKDQVIENNSSTVDSDGDSNSTVVSQPDVSQDDQGGDSSQPVVEDAKPIKALSVEKTPDKLEYRVGEQFDCTGLELRVVYDDDSSEIVKEDFIFETIIFENPGEQSVKVSYRDKSVDLIVTVAELKVDSIKIVGFPNTYYSVGQTLDTEGLALNVVYSDGSEETVTEGFTCTPTTFTTGGDVEVKVSYGDKETSFMVTVSSVTVTSVSVTKTPNTLSYYKGDTLDTRGLLLTVNYSDGTSETLTSGFSCTPTVLNQVGNSVKVTVSYGGKEDSFTVRVQELKAVKLTVKTLPKYTTYNKNDTLNTSGLTLDVEYSNGEHQVITKGFTYTPKTLTQAGNAVKITVSYAGLSTGFTVKVLDVKVSSVSIKTTPKYTTYYKGDSLNQSGLTLTVKYSDGSSKTVSSGFTCSPTTFTQSGNAIKVTVSYQGFTDSFTVKVLDVLATKITVKSKPTKTTYTVGEKLNTSGLTLTVSYKDGSSKTVTSGFTCSPTTLNSTGTVKITVSYSGLTTSFDVKVNPEEVTVKSIKVKTMPTKTTYKVGDTLNTSGLTLTVNYSDGSSKTISSGFTWNPKTLNTAGSAVTITIEYMEATTTFTVKVEPDSGVTWTLSNGTLTISGEGPMADYTSSSQADWRSQKSQIKRVVIEPGITSIGAYAFYECSSLISVSIPNTVTSIGNSSFYGCYFSSITIPGSVKSIGGNAFCMCSALKSITIPNSVKSIGQSAFSRCNALTSVAIPTSVTNIKTYAFSQCSSLTNVTYKGTKSQWNSVTKGTDWNKNSPFTGVTCSDGKASVS